MPVYDKPMIFYPLSTLMEAGIREILIITTAEDLALFEKLLGDGKKLGCSFSYEIQKEPKGLAQAFLIGKKFIGNDRVALILGDNIFFGGGMKSILKDAKEKKGAVIFAYEVSDPERYGVVDFDKNGNAVSLEEKPMNPKSNYAVPGLYFYDNDVIEFATKLKPSSRGEYEITDINKNYLENQNLSVKVLEKGTQWLDTGTFDSLLEAGNFVQIMARRKGIKVACIEEVAFRMGYINAKDLLELSKPLMKSDYGMYLRGLIE
jgi:glucose-1-phosphate thymidylyltransferase